MIKSNIHIHTLYIYDDLLTSGYVKNHWTLGYLNFLMVTKTPYSYGCDNKVVACCKMSEALQSCDNLA